MGHLGIFDELEISKIDFAKTLLRVNYGSIEELASSIASKGLLQPIVVRVVLSRYEVIAGNRRLSACRLLKWRKIPCHIVELDDRESFEVSLIENVQHKTLNPIEEATAFKKYVENFGWGGISELARRIGKSQEYVTRRIQLLQLPGKVQDKVMRRRISPSIAQELLNVDSKTAEKFAEMIENKALKRNEVRQIVKSIKKEYPHGFDGEGDSYPAYGELATIIDGALRKCIAILKSTLVRIDEIIGEVDEDWITKEMLMQYRLIIHGDIDTFMRLRKKLRRKMRPTYHSRIETDDNKTEYNKMEDNASNNNLERNDTPLYMYKCVWQ